jgi:hypothetical protein
MHPSFFIARFSALPCSSVVGPISHEEYSLSVVYILTTECHGTTRNRRYTNSPCPGGQKSQLSKPRIPVYLFG